MLIHGFQKLTLLDFPERMAATVFTGGCNFRCPFCHNASLVTHMEDAPRLTEAEVLSYLETRKNLLDGICITGGEPLLQPDIADFIRKARSIVGAVKLDTNGCFPDRLKALIDTGSIDYVAMDVKNSREKYALTAGTDNFSLDSIDESIRILIHSGLDYEFRTTVVEELHTPKDIENIASWIKGAKRYFLQNFKDSGDLIGGGMHPVPDEILQNMQERAENLGVVTKIRK